MTLHLRAFWLACLADCSAFERAFWLANVKYKGLQVGEIFSQLLFATCLLAVPWLGSRACVARSFGRTWLFGLPLARLFCLAHSACLLPRRFVILSVAKNPHFKGAIRTLNLRLNLNSTYPTNAECGYFATPSMTSKPCFCGSPFATLRLLLPLRNVSAAAKPPLLLVAKVL